jgi:DNA polymerase-1
MVNNTLVLVDGSYYLFRAYHAIRDLKNSANEPTGAIYGVINMLRKIRADLEPDYFAVVFDPKGKTFRNELYPEYKAHRPPPPDDLVTQIAPIHQIIRALGIPLIIIDGVEADDVIASLAKQAETHGLKTTISSGDKDLAQVVNGNITIINTMSDVTLDPRGVEEKYGVPPERIIDYLALVGDSVDNVPGVPKVGPKTAVKWLQEYGSLDAIMEHAHEIPGKVGESLRAALRQLPLSKQLVTLKTDLALDLAPEDLIPGKPDITALREQYRRWEFRGLLNSLESGAQAGAGPAAAAGDKQATAAVPDRDYSTIFDKNAFEQWVTHLQQVQLFSIDTETTSLDYMQAEIVGLSFATAPGKAAYVPLAHDYPGAPDQLSRDYVLNTLRPLLESAVHGKLGHNLKYDMSVLANHGILLAGVRHDTMLQSYVLDSTASRHDMDSLALKYLDLVTVHYEEVAGKGAKQIPFSQVAVEQAAPYAAEDADVTLRLHHYFWPRLAAEPGLKELYETTEIPLIGILSAMERNGVLIDAGLLKQQSRELGAQLRDIEKEIHGLAGQPFNIGSPKQIQEILYDKMGLPILSRTAKGQPSTAESVLQELAADYELPRLILDHRSMSKLKSTYTDRLPDQIDRGTGRVHTSFHQAVASTGRLSSSDPNLQNIPVRSAAGRRIRQAFIAPPGSRILAADYSQIELRIMAHLSADRGLLDAFAGLQDIHRSTAADILSVPLDEVTPEQRRAAKAINFGLMYGMSPFGLAKQLGIDRSEAKQYVDRYFARYPSVRDFMERIRATAREQGYVETVFRRRLYLPEIHSRNAARRQYAERTAINAPMQGTAADIIKRAMIAIDAQLLQRHVEIKLIMQVHDELVFEVPAKLVDSATVAIRRHMEGAAELSVPLKVDIGIGDNWDEAH